MPVLLNKQHPMKSQVTILIFLFAFSFFVPRSEPAKAVFTDNQGFFTPVTIVKNLSFGMRNDAEVVKLQQALIERGYMTLGQATGNLFSTTRGAVMSFQTNHSIPATGYVGPLTRAELAKTGEKLYLLGGLANFAGRSNDIWSTPDGIAWTREALHANWERRTQFGAALFNNKLFVISGTAEEGMVNDAWSSSDAITWNLENSNLPWCYRADFSVVTLNKIHYVIGGSGGCTLGKNDAGSDVWSSTDGKTWTRILASAPWGPRSLHSTVVFDEKIWILGGKLVNDEVNDVWSSPDGIKWTREVEEAPWESRSHHQAIVYKDQIFLVGGSTSNDGEYEYFSDVWSTSDGSKWTSVTSRASFGGRESFGLSTLNNKLILIGGVGDNGSGDVGRQSDVWSTSDGKVWTKITNDAPWEERDTFGLVRTVNP